MIGIDCQQFLVAEDEGSLRLAQAMNPRYRFLPENNLPETLPNYILLCLKRLVMGLNVAAEDKCPSSITHVLTQEQSSS